MNRPDYEFGLEKDPEFCFDLINPDLYEEVRVVPREAIEFYKEWGRRGERGAPAWGKIPHVLVQDSLDTSSLEIIDWRDSIA